MTAAKGMTAEELDATIRELNTLGWNDTRIANHIGETNSRIGDRRRNMGLPSRADPSASGKAGARKARAAAQARNMATRVKDARDTMHRFAQLDAAALDTEDREAMVRDFLARGGKITICPPAAVAFTTADVPTSWQLREHIKDHGGGVVGFMAAHAREAIEAEHAKIKRRRAA